MTVLEKLLQFLEEEKIPFKHLEHQPTHTSKESAKARNEPLEIGAKALVMKLDDQLKLFVLSASKKLDSKKIKSELKCRSLRFATAEELLTLTSLVPGSVPPFGKPILPFPLFIDPSIQTLPKMAFNGGSLTHSIVMDTADYLKLSKGTLLAFSES